MRYVFKKSRLCWKSWEELLMNFILNKNNFPLLDISYSKRNSYYNALERAQINKNEDIFIQWFFRRYLDEYKNI